MTTAIKVLVVDDHPVFRSGLRGAVGALAGAELVGEAADGATAVTLALDLRPDVVLMDLRMDGLSGIEAIRRITTALPATKVLVLTMSDDDESVFAALRAGASGYLLKGVGETEIAAAIASVSRGEALFGAGVAQRLLDQVTGRQAPVTQPFPELTPREVQILGLMAAGLGNAGIAHKLTVSPKTIRNSVSTVLSKLHAADRAEAIARARAAGLGAEESKVAGPTKIVLRCSNQA